MKDQKVVFGVSFAVLVLVLALIATFLYTRNGGNNNSDNSQTIQSDLKDNFTLTKEYKGENSWEFAVNGYLPTPCYSYKLDTVVLESFPEQVKINLTITKPAADVICAQVLQDVSENGTFGASEKASVELVVLEN